MPKNYKDGGKAEWSYLISIDDIRGDPKTFTFKPSERERIDVARRLGLISIESSEASVTLQRAGGGMIHAMGIIRADVTQNCVVTMAPLPVHIEDEFEGWFGSKDQAVSFAKARNEREAKKAHAEFEVLEESVDPEPIVNGKVDIGELATQYLSLALDPYPHAQGATHEFNPPDKKGDDGAKHRRSPFEALKDWKEKR